ncbi:MAG: PAS domain S-box protein, partial [Acidimicrobiia bacterium]|nr:PAS domain S-box protein [Acidimicrobiia bacterium]
MEYAAGGPSGYALAGLPLLEEGAAHQALTRARVTIALSGVVVHTYLNLVWDLDPWLLGISAIHLLVASMVVAESGTAFAPLAIAFDGAVAVSLGIVGGDPRIAAPWLIASVPLLLVVVAPRVGLILLAVPPVGYAVTATVVRALERPALLTESQVNTYLPIALLAVLGAIAVLVVEVGWAMRRRAGEEEIRVRELEMLTDSSPVGMAIQDIHRRFVYTNPRLRDMLCLTVAQIERNGFSDAIPAEVQARIDPLILDGQLKREAIQYQHAIKRPDGSLGWLDVSMSEPLLQADGTPLFVFTVFDISEKIAATTRSTRFAEALDGTSDIVLLWDSLRRPLHMNTAFLQFFGSNESDRSAAVPRIFEVLDEHLPRWPHLPGGSTAAFEAEFARRASGRPVPFSIVVTVAQDEHHGGRSFALLARDVSAQRHVSEELREVVRAKDQFIASVSHELRTPLTVVLGLATELAENVGTFGREEVIELAELIAEQSADVAAIVEDLLMVARADAGVLTVVPNDVALGPLVMDALLSAPTEMSVNVEPSVHALSVIADAGRLRQVIRNLLINA